MSILVGRFHLPITPANVITVAACSILSFFLADRIAFDVAQTASLRLSPTPDITSDAN
jgi:putative flippase GtrA